MVPVRETCAQALGAVVKHMKNSSVLKIAEILTYLEGRSQWEVRLAGFIATKYLLATRTDLVPELIPRILHAIIDGYFSSVDQI